MITLRRVSWVVVVVLLGSTRVLAQSVCTPVPVRTLAWGTPGQSIVPAAEDKTTNLVPAGEIWLIKAAGIGQGADPGAALEYRLQIDHQWPDLSYWYIAVEVVVPMRGTPVVALSRPIVLEAGERLSARSNSMPNGGTMYVMAVGWHLPASCLPQVLGVMAGTAPPMPNFSSLLSAATGLQQAAAALQAAIPR